MTLTREEILAMEPGRKLNRLVQEHIFKWIPWQEGRGDYTAIVYQKPGEREPYMKTQRWETAEERYSIIVYSEIDEMRHAVYGDKDWSTDISAAWEVVEKMRQNKIYLDLRVWPHDYQVLPHQDENNKLIDRWIVKKEILPEAICKAALLAVLDL